MVMNDIHTMTTLQTRQAYVCMASYHQVNSIWSLSIERGESMKIECCANCIVPKRHIGCHGTCPDYIEQSARIRELNEEIHKKKMLQSTLTSVSIEGSERTMSRRSSRSRVRAAQ